MFAGGHPIGVPTPTASTGDMAVILEMSALASTYHSSSSATWFDMRELNAHFHPPEGIFW